MLMAFYCLILQLVSKMSCVIHFPLSDICMRRQFRCFSCQQVGWCLHLIDLYPFLRYFSGEAFKSILQSWTIKSDKLIVMLHVGYLEVCYHGSKSLLQSCCPCGMHRASSGLGDVKDIGLQEVPQERTKIYTDKKDRVNAQTLVLLQLYRQINVSVVNEKDPGCIIRLTRNK